MRRDEDQTRWQGDRGRGYFVIQRLQKLFHHFQSSLFPMNKWMTHFANIRSPKHLPIHPSIHPFLFFLFLGERERERGREERGKRKKLFYWILSCIFQHSAYSSLLSTYSIQFTSSHVFSLSADYFVFKCTLSYQLICN